MNPVEAAVRMAKPTRDLTANFMLDSATYERGNELGFDGFDFYVAGRGGVLGDVDAAIVSASFVFFNPAMIRHRWERARGVMAPREAALVFAGCLHSWSDQHLCAGPSYARLAGLTGKVIASAGPAGAPLFAGWRSLPEPDDEVALAMHRLNGLRELRGALHGAAVLAQGLDPLVALLVKTPFLAGVFGWKEPFPDVELAREAWQAAETATDVAMGRVLASLDEPEQQELAELLEAAHAAVH